ncbi:MAG: DedA family protein, partial [Sphingomonadales bacterium]
LVGHAIIATYGAEQQFARFRAAYNEWGVWIVAMFGATPFPYKIITIASGVTALNVFTFMLASLASRGLTFFLIAGILKYGGPTARQFIEKRLGLFMTLGFVLLIGGFAALKLL